MRPAKAISCILSIVGVCALAPRTPAQTLASRQPIVIAASVVIDGKGHILHDVRIVIEGSKIVAIGPKIEGPVDYDLRGLTVLPGWIDAHVHITWIFGKDGANAGTEGTTQEDAYQAASNAWVTLMAGFTTVQSVGAPQRYSAARCYRERNTPRPAYPDGQRTARRTRRGDRHARRDPRLREEAKANRRGPDQNLRVEVHSPGRRNDSFAGAIERGL